MGYITIAVPAAVVGTDQQAFRVMRTLGLAVTMDPNHQTAPNDHATSPRIVPLLFFAAKDAILEGLQPPPQAWSALNIALFGHPVRREGSDQYTISLDAVAWWSEVESVNNSQGKFNGCSGTKGSRWRRQEERQGRQTANRILTDNSPRVNGHRTPSNESNGSNESNASP